jgi:hypothetical protein
MYHGCVLWYMLEGKQHEISDLCFFFMNRQQRPWSPGIIFFLVCFVVMEILKRDYEPLAPLMQLQNFPQIRLCLIHHCCRIYCVLNSAGSALALSEVMRDLSEITGINDV